MDPDNMVVGGRYMLEFIDPEHGNQEYGPYEFIRRIEEGNKVRYVVDYKGTNPELMGENHQPRLKRSHYENGLIKFKVAPQAGGKRKRKTARTRRRRRFA